MANHKRYSEEQKQWFADRLRPEQRDKQKLMEDFKKTFGDDDFGTAQYKYLRGEVGKDPKYNMPLLRDHRYGPSARPTNGAARGPVMTNMEKYPPGPHVPASEPHRMPQNQAGATGASATGPPYAMTAAQRSAMAAMAAAGGGATPMLSRFPSGMMVAPGQLPSQYLNQVAGYPPVLNRVVRANATAPASMGASVATTPQMMMPTLPEMPPTSGPSVATFNNPRQFHCMLQSTPHLQANPGFTFGPGGLVLPHGAAAAAAHQRIQNLSAEQNAAGRSHSAPPQPHDQCAATDPAALLTLPGGAGGGGSLKRKREPGSSSPQGVDPTIPAATTNTTTAGAGVTFTPVVGCPINCAVSVDQYKHRHNADGSVTFRSLNDVNNLFLGGQLFGVAANAGYGCLGMNPGAMNPPFNTPQQAVMPHGNAAAVGGGAFAAADNGSGGGGDHDDRGSFGAEPNSEGGDGGEDTVYPQLGSPFHVVKQSSDSEEWDENGEYHQ